jgi:hypothetical protein
MTDQVEGPADEPVKKRPGPEKGKTYRKGWKKVTYNSWTMNIQSRLEQLIKSPLISEDVKTQAVKLLATVVDNRMTTENFGIARNLIKANRLLNQKEIRKLRIEETATSHAVFMACQACDNLRDRIINVRSGQERIKMVMQIAMAISALSEIQTQLIGASDDEK